jgi:hypothetical protein
MCMRFSLTYGVTEEKNAIEFSQLFLLLEAPLGPKTKIKPKLEEHVER